MRNLLFALMLVLSPFIYAEQPEPIGEPEAIEARWR